MTRFRFAAIALCLLLAACKDPRRDLARAHVLAHPPEGFAVASTPENIPIKDIADGEAEALTSVRYRLLRPTIELRDGFALPRARALAEQLAELRGWTLGALPAGDSTRESILSGVAQARGPFPVKRIVTPAGAEVDVLASLRLRKANSRWEIIGFKADATVPGAPDADATIPFEDSFEVAARIAKLSATVQGLETIRRKSIAEREERAAQSLAKLRVHFQTGRTFAGSLPDGSPLRIVVSHGLEGGGPAIAVVTIRSATGESAARFTGSLVQQPSGETIWRAAQATTLSSPAESTPPSITDSSAQPVLSLRSAGTDLEGHLEINRRPPVPLALRPAPSIDLIPDPALSPSNP